MNTTERGQRQTEKNISWEVSHPRHAWYSQKNIHVDDLTHQNYEKKKTGILMTQPTEPTTRSSSPLKNYRYIYFAFLEIIIEVHITLMEINSEGRYGMHGAMGRKQTEHPLVNLSKN